MGVAGVAAESTDSAVQGDVDVVDVVVDEKGVATAERHAVLSAEELRGTRYVLLLPLHASLAYEADTEYGDGGEVTDILPSLVIASNYNARSDLLSEGIPQ